jgi:hypothetical protein
MLHSSGEGATQNVTPIQVDNIVIADMVRSDSGKITVRGLTGEWDRPEDAQHAVLERHAHTIELAEKHRAQNTGLKVTLGKALYGALIENGNWVGRPIQETKTQIIVEVGHTDMLKASLTGMIHTLDTAARQNTKSESNSMKARALIGAARQQLKML